MSTIAALGPNEVLEVRKASMPDAVLELFNELIMQKFNGSEAVVYQKTVVSKLEARGYSRNDIYNKGWLDVEDIYREKGWKVYYDKPAYCESYDAYFKFSVK